MKGGDTVSREFLIAFCSEQSLKHREFVPSKVAVSPRNGQRLESTLRTLFRSLPTETLWRYFCFLRDRVAADGHDDGVHNGSVTESVTASNARTRAKQRILEQEVGSALSMPFEDTASLSKRCTERAERRKEGVRSRKSRSLCQRLVGRDGDSLIGAVCDEVDGLLALYGEAAGPDDEEEDIERRSHLAMEMKHVVVWRKLRERERRRRRMRKRKRNESNPLSLRERVFTEQNGSDFLLNVQTVTV